MKIYIVANNHLLSKDYIEKLNTSDDDIFFLFNYMYQSYDLTKEKKKIAFLRGLESSKEGDDYYLGGNKFVNIQMDFQKVILIWDDLKNYTKNIKIPKEVLYIDEIVHYFNIEYPGESPSSGFLAVLYAMKFYKDYEIVLLGFTGRFADGKLPPDNFIHNYKWELEYYNKQNIKMINIS